MDQVYIGAEVAEVEVKEVQLVLEMVD